MLHKEMPKKEGHFKWLFVFVLILIGAGFYIFTRPPTRQTSFPVATTTRSVVPSKSINTNTGEQEAKGGATWVYWVLGFLGLALGALAFYFYFFKKEKLVNPFENASAPQKRMSITPIWANELHRLQQKTKKKGWFRPKNDYLKRYMNAMEAKRSLKFYLGTYISTGLQDLDKRKIDIESLLTFYSSKNVLPLNKEEREQYNL